MKKERHNIPLTGYEIALIVTALETANYGRRDLAVDGHWLSKDIIERLKASGNL